MDGVTRLDCMKKADDYKVGRCRGNTSLGYRQMLSILTGFDFISKKKQTSLVAIKITMKLMKITELKTVELPTLAQTYSMSSI